MPATSDIHTGPIHAKDDGKKTEVSPAAEKKHFGVFCDEWGYLAQIEYIMQHGCRKGDRTGTGVISVFGAQARYSLRDQFPLLTTKRVFWKGILEELLWFIKGAMQLARETEQKLEEAEQQCHDLTKSSFEECRPCLEDTCKAFYTSTCRRGFASFSFKVEEFFRKMAAQLDATERVYNQNEENAGWTSSPQNRVEEGKAELELLQAEASFGQLLSNISLLYNQSLTLVKKMQQRFGHSFSAAFTAEIQPSTLSGVQDDSAAGFLATAGLDHILDSVYDFGRNVLEEFSSTVTDVFEEIHEAEESFQPSSRDAGSLTILGESQSRYMCRRLRRQASECWQLQDLCETCKDYLLKECPSVQQLHSEMEEMYMLLNASRQQYDDRLQLVQRHTADTQRWLSSMDDKYGWVSQLSNSTAGPHDIFSVITVIPQEQMKNIRSKPDSSVVVTILDSAPFTVLVPADLEADDPAFIQYAAQEALTLHKQEIRSIDPGSIEA